MTRYTMLARSLAGRTICTASSSPPRTRRAPMGIRSQSHTRSRMRCAEVDSSTAERLLLRPAADVYPACALDCPSRDAHRAEQHPLSTSSMARNDEAVEVDARGLNALGTVKALIKATGLNPHLSVCGWPFCLDELDDAHTEGDVA